MIIKLTSGLLVAIVGIIHLIPVTGVIGVHQLEKLYGVSLNDPNLILLMRHRALLFGLVGGMLVYAAFVPSYQLIAIVIGLVSVVGFLVLAWQAGPLHANIGKVVRIDWVALVLLMVAGGLEIFRP